MAIKELREQRFDKLGCFDGSDKVGPFVQFDGGPVGSIAEFYATAVTTHLKDVGKVDKYAAIAARAQAFVEKGLEAHCKDYAGAFVLTHYGARGCVGSGFLVD